MTKRMNTPAQYNEADQRVRQAFGLIRGEPKELTEHQLAIAIAGINQTPDRYEAYRDWIHLLVQRNFREEEPVVTRYVDPRAAWLSPEAEEEWPKITIDEAGTFHFEPVAGTVLVRTATSTSAKPKMITIKMFAEALAIQGQLYSEKDGGLSEGFVSELLLRYVPKPPDLKALKIELAVELCRRIDREEERKQADPLYKKRTMQELAKELEEEQEGSIIFSASEIMDARKNYLSHGRKNQRRSDLNL